MIRCRILGLAALAALAAPSPRADAATPPKGRSFVGLLTQTHRGTKPAASPALVDARSAANLSAVAPPARVSAAAVSTRTAPAGSFVQAAAVSNPNRALARQLAAQLNAGERRAFQQEAVIAREISSLQRELRRHPGRASSFGNELAIARIAGQVAQLGPETVALGNLASALGALAPNDSLVRRLSFQLDNQISPRASSLSATAGRLEVQVGTPSVPGG